MLWRAIVTSFRLEERGSLVALLMRYGPFLLGGLVLLIALVFLRKSSSKKLVRPILSTRPMGGNGEESGFSRALDGLPMYGQAPGDFREPAAAGPPQAGQGTPPPAPIPPPSGDGPIKAPTIPRAAPALEDGPGRGAPYAPAVAAERVPPADDGLPPPSGGPSGLPRKLPPAEAPPPLAQAPTPPPQPVVPTAGALQSPAVAERIEIQDLPAGSDQPTNVAMRNAQAPVPEADSADQVLSRLMGLDDEDPAPALAPAEAAKSTPDSTKIQRNSDFLT